MLNTMFKAGLLFTSVKTVTRASPATATMATSFGNWAPSVAKFRQVLRDDPVSARVKLCDLYDLVDELKSTMDVRNEARRSAPYDYEAAERQREEKVAERLRTPGMCEVPWCRDGDDEFRKEMEERESKTQATTAWMDIVTIPIASGGEAAPVTEDFVVKEGRALSMVARGWSLGTTSWDGPADNMKEWVPCTPAAREDHLESCRRRSARVAAYEAEVGWSDSVRASRPPTNTATAGRLLAGALEKKDFRNKAAEDTIKSLREKSKFDKAAKTAARHASNKQRREAGQDTGPKIEDEDPREAEEVSMSREPARACKTRTRHPGNMQRSKSAVDDNGLD